MEYAAAWLALCTVPPGIDVDVLAAVAMQLEQEPDR